MRHFFSIAAAVSFAALVASTATAQERGVSPPAGPEATRTGNDASQAVRQMHQRFEAALNDGDAAALARLYSEDAILLPPAPEHAAGNAAIQQYWEADISEGGLSDLTIQNTEVRRVGDAILDIGRYRISGRGPDGEPATFNGHYMVLLEPAADNEWRIARHIWNQDLPDPPQER